MLSDLVVGGDMACPKFWVLAVLRLSPTRAMSDPAAPVLCVRGGRGGGRGDDCPLACDI